MAPSEQELRDFKAIPAIKNLETVIDAGLIPGLLDTNNTNGEYEGEILAYLANISPYQRQTVNSYLKKNTDAISKAALTAKILSYSETNLKKLATISRHYEEFSIIDSKSGGDIFALLITCKSPAEFQVSVVDKFDFKNTKFIEDLYKYVSKNKEQLKQVVPIENLKALQQLLQYPDEKSSLATLKQDLSVLAPVTSVEKLLTDLLSTDENADAYIDFLSQVEDYEKLNVIFNNESYIDNLKRGLPFNTPKLPKLISLSNMYPVFEAIENPNKEDIKAIFKQALSENDDASFDEAALEILAKLKPTQQQAILQKLQENYSQLNTTVGPKAQAKLNYLRNICQNLPYLSPTNRTQVCEGKSLELLLVIPHFSSEDYLHYLSRLDKLQRKQLGDAIQQKLRELLPGDAQIAKLQTYEKLLNNCGLVSSLATEITIQASVIYGYEDYLKSQIELKRIAEELNRSPSPLNKDELTLKQKELSLKIKAYEASRDGLAQPFKENAEKVSTITLEIKRLEIELETREIVKEISIKEPLFQTKSAQIIDLTRVRKSLEDKESKLRTATTEFKGVNINLAVLKRERDHLKQQLTDAQQLFLKLTSEPSPSIPKKKNPHDIPSKQLRQQLIKIIDQRFNPIKPHTSNVDTVEKNKRIADFLAQYNLENKDASLSVDEFKKLNLEEKLNCVLKTQAYLETFSPKEKKIFNAYSEEVNKLSENQSVSSPTPKAQWMVKIGDILLEMVTERFYPKVEGKLDTNKQRQNIHNFIEHYNAELKPNPPLSRKQFDRLSKEEKLQLVLKVPPAFHNQYFGKYRPLINAYNDLEKKPQNISEEQIKALLSEHSGALNKSISEVSSRDWEAQKNTEIKRLEEQKQTTKIMISSLKSEIKGLESNIRTIPKQSQSIEAEVEALSQEIENLNSRLNESKAILKDMPSLSSGEGVSIEEQLESAKAKLASLKEEQEALKKPLTDAIDILSKGTTNFDSLVIPDGCILKSINIPSESSPDASGVVSGSQNSVVGRLFSEITFSAIAGHELHVQDQGRGSLYFSVADPKVGKNNDQGLRDFSFMLYSQWVKTKDQILIDAASEEDATKIKQIFQEISKENPEFKIQSHLAFRGPQPQILNVKEATREEVKDLRGKFMTFKAKINQSNKDDLAESAAQFLIKNCANPDIRTEIKQIKDEKLKNAILDRLRTNDKNPYLNVARANYFKQLNRNEVENNDEVNGMLKYLNSNESSTQPKTTYPPELDQLKSALKKKETPWFSKLRGN